MFSIIESARQGQTDSTDDYDDADSSPALQ